MTELEDKKGQSEEDAALWREGGSGTSGRWGGKDTKKTDKASVTISKTSKGPLRRSPTINEASLSSSYRQ